MIQVPGISPSWVIMAGLSKYSCWLANLPSLTVTTHTPGSSTVLPVAGISGASGIGSGAF